MIKLLLKVDAFADVNYDPRIAGKMHALQIRRIVLLERFQYTNLNPACVAVLLHRADDLDSDFTPRRDLPGFDHLAKRALTEQAYDLVYSLASIRYRSPPTYTCPQRHHRA